MGRPKEFDTTVRVRLNFMQSAFLKHLAELADITEAEALRAVIEKAMLDALEGRFPYEKEQASES